MNPNLEKGARYRFKPGQSGNPGGRPKRLVVCEWLSDRLSDRLECKLPERLRIKYDFPEGITWADAILERELERALEGKTVMRLTDPRTRKGQNRVKGANQHPARA
jgi:Family of unknown function (DUF5681)